LDEKLQSNKKFVSMVVHDLRNPVVSLQLSTVKLIDSIAKLMANKKVQS